MEAHCAAAAAAAAYWHRFLIADGFFCLFVCVSLLFIKHVCHHGFSKAEKSN